MNTFPEIDADILAAASSRWQKVAMIISRVSKSAVISENGFELDDNLCNFIASRIETLVAERKLLSKGNIKLWRHSEVCLP